MKRIGLHYEQFCGDVPAPAWSELPKANPRLVGVRVTAPVGDAPPIPCVGQGEDTHGAAHSEGGTQTTTDSHESPATERDDAAPPFKVGDKCMIMRGYDEDQPAIYLGDESSEDGSRFSFDRGNGKESFFYTRAWYPRHPTPAELAEHWPDEWIPCTSEEQRLALGDARVYVRTQSGYESMYTYSASQHALPGWGDSITHYRLARSK